MTSRYITTLPASPRTRIYIRRAGTHTRNVTSHGPHVANLKPSAAAILNPERGHFGSRQFTTPWSICCSLNPCHFAGKNSLVPARNPYPNAHFPNHNMVAVLPTERHVSSNIVQSESGPSKAASWLHFFMSCRNIGPPPTAPNQWDKDTLDVSSTNGFNLRP